MTNEQKAKITELRTAGFGYTNIAKALAITKNQVVSYCHRNGLTGEKATHAAAKKPDVGICKNCGKSIVQVPGRKQIKFCSYECCQSWWNSHPEAINRHSEAFYSFTCACCGKLFTAYGNRNRKYCSHSCYISGRFGDVSHE